MNLQKTPEGTIHGANMGPIWGRQDPGGPHVGPMNLGHSVAHTHEQAVKYLLWVFLRK